MLVIPPEKNSTSSEGYVRDLLHEVNFDDARAFWSLHVPSHVKKPWSECDFIIAWKKSLICLEVKGGHKISRNEEGIWRYEELDGNYFTKNESPMDQVSSCSQSIRRRLIDQLGKEVVNKFIIGWGVVFPFHNFKSIKGFEHDPRVMIDKEGISSSEGLKNFIISLEKHWRSEININPPEADPQDFSTMVKYLRGEFNLVRPLSSYIEESEDKLLQITLDQLDLLSSIELNERCLCQGGAGTGKTLMAIEIAKIKKNEGKRVAFVCRNKEFANYVQSALFQYGITILCTEQINKDIEIKKFEAIVVDEGQDCMTFDQIELIESILEGGLDEGSCYWFMDSNNQSHFYTDYDSTCIDFFNKYAKFSLSTNCRNTLPIVEVTRALTGADCGKPAIKAPGLTPEVLVGDSPEDQATQLAVCLGDLLEDGNGLNPSDITILTNSSEEKSCVNLLSSNQLNLLGRFNKNEGNINKINFFDALCFKGQENKAIVIVDIYDLGEKQFDLSKLYTMLSRPNHCLKIIASKTFQKTYNQKLTKAGK